MQPGKAYIAMLARSRALDVYRSRAAGVAATQRSAVREQPLQPEREDDVCERVLRHERTHGLLTAPETVPRTQRQALLASAHGLTSIEFARRARIPEGTAKSRLRLGLAKARTALEHAA